MTDPKDPSQASPHGQQPPEQEEGLQQYLSGASATPLPPKSGRRPRYLPPEESQSKKPKFSINIPLPSAGQDNYGQSDMVENSLFSLEGRIGRLSYQAGLFILVLGLLIGIFVFGLLFAFSAQSLMMMATGHGFPIGPMLLIFLLFIAFVAGAIILGIRRLHDLNLSGFWILLPLGVAIAGGVLRAAGITFGPIISSLVSALFSLGLALVPGTAGNNQYGPIRHTPGIEKVLGWIYLVFVAICILYGINHRPAHRYVSPYATSAPALSGLDSKQQARLDDAMKQMTPEQKAKFEESMKKLQAIQEQLKAEQAAQSGQAAPASNP